MQQASESPSWKLLKDILIPVFIPLVVALLAFVGVAITVLQSTLNTAIANKSQIIDGHRKTVRDERFGAYENFLKAANTYRWATLLTQMDCARFAHELSTTESAQKCSELVRKQVIDSFMQFKTTADHVKIFGSEQAGRVVTEMLKRAPHSKGPNGPTFEQCYDALLQVIRFESQFVDAIAVR